MSQFGCYMTSYVESLKDFMHTQRLELMSSLNSSNTKSTYKMDVISLHSPLATRIKNEENYLFLRQQRE